MSFVGLDFGRAGNVYADLLRQAHQERIKQQQWEEQNRINQQQAGALYGYPLGEDYFMALPFDESTLSQGTIDATVVEGRDPANDAEANLLANDLAAGLVGQKKTQLPTGPRVQGSLSVPDQPFKGNPQKSPGGTQLNVGGALSTVDPIRVLEEQEAGRIASIFDKEIAGIVSQAKKVGLVKDGKAHPSVVRQIQELREQRLKAMTGGGRSLYDLALLEAMRQQRPVQSRASSKPKKDPRVVALDEKISSLQKDPNYKAYASTLGNFVQMPTPATKEGERIAQEIRQYQLQKDALTGIGSTQPEAPRNVEPQRYKVGNEMLTKEEIKTKYPNTYKKKFGGK